jgi:uncharacterized protein
MSVIFVDSSAWIALINGREQLHERAKSGYAALLAEGARFVTSSDVLDETITRLRYDIGLQASQAFREAVAAAEKSKALRVIFVESVHHLLAWKILLRYPKLKLSFTDATSAALAGHLKVNRVFTFDADFRVLGFHVVP